MLGSTIPLVHVVAVVAVVAVVVAAAAAAAANICAQKREAVGVGTGCTRACPYIDYEV